MIKTVALSTFRIESIKNQFAYALKVLGKLKMERIVLFLREIEAKNIAEISFHGLKPNSYESDESIFISVDWGKHSELIKQGEIHVETDDTFEDGVAPETLIECYLFKENCEKKGLRIEMRVNYPERITANQYARAKLNSKLGLRPTTPSEKIKYSEGSTYKSTIGVKSIQEMSITRYSN
ncbi:MAG: hypothetical protein J1F01_02490 [Oscillospiraceae bacterium]|nr:hypothetical protein [Oscillospiraceae bacterium]